MKKNSTSIAQKVFCRLWLLMFFAVVTFSLLLSSNHFLPKSNIPGHINTASRKLVASGTANIQAMVATKETRKPLYSFNPYAGPHNPKIYRYANVTSLIPLGNIPLHVLSKERRYMNRMLDMRERCQNYSTDGFTSIIDLRRYVYDKYHNTIMCIVPKNACTTWKAIMMYLMGKTMLETWSHINARHLDLDYGSIKSLRAVPLPVAAALFSSTTKFMVTRHPFDRLVSAYRSKFGKGKTGYWYTRGRYIARNGIKQFLGANYTFSLNKKKRNETITNMSLSPAFTMLPETDKKYILDLANRAFIGNITFEEFLRYAIIANPGESRRFDVHWRPQYMLCNPCAINFDFIIRFENLGEESKHILDYLQRFDAEAQRIEFPSSRSSAVTQSVSKEYFNSIPQEVVESVIKVYEGDFRYFNYHPEHY